jgi:hypothetical protein
MEKGPAKMLTFRGSKVFESRPFDIDFIGEPYDLLVRRRQIGEHFVVGAAPDPPAVAGVAVDAAANLVKRDTFIYSMDTDNFERIKFTEAYRIAKSEYDATDKPVIKEGEEGYEEGKANKRPLPGWTADPTEATSAVLLFRPFETYDMASAILLKRGLETGMTAHGHHDFMLSDDVIHKVHIGHYTFYHASVVKQPKNITIAEDIFARNYVSGEGTAMYANPGEFTEDQHNPTFAKDLIAVLIPRKDFILSNPCDITGRFEGSILDIVPTDLSDSDRSELYPNSDAFAGVYQFDAIKNYGDDSVGKFINPLRHNNTVTWQGMQLNHNPEDGGKFNRITLATGHWGTNVYSGCKSVRTGENAFLKDMEYEKVRTRQGQF